MAIIRVMFRRSVDAFLRPTVSATVVQYKPCEICTTQSWCETHGCQCYPVSAVQPERCCLDYPRCDCNSPPEPDNLPCGHPWKAQHDFKCILCSAPGDATYAQLTEEQRFRRSTMHWHKRATEAEARLQKIMARCADLLDEDQFNELDAMMGGICDAWVIAPAQKTLTDLARETNYQPSRYEAHLEARLADAEALLRDARSSIPGNAKFTLRRIDDFLRAGVTTVTVAEVQK